MLRTFRYFNLTLVLLLGAALPTQAQQVPRQIDYCGIELTFTPAARQKLNELVYQLTNSPRYFNQMLRRAQLYMPYIEEAFRAEGVPADLRFLAIQESGLKPSVVSSSQAVGFWQFKAETGREVGLQIDSDVDERRHIYRSSTGAARYLSRANYHFDNWVYAVIAYYEGQTGAVAYTDAQYYGRNAMTVDENLHWYVLKAIAHKLAYEPALQQPIVLEEYLIPFSTEGETDLRDLAELHNLSTEAFHEHNPWILTRRRLPRDQFAYTYYVPVLADQYAGHMPDPVAHPALVAESRPPSPQPSESQPKPSAQPPASSPASQTQPEEIESRPPTPEERPLNSPLQSLSPDAGYASDLAESFYAAFPFEADLHYGREFVRFDGTLSVVDMASRYQVRFTKLLEWNELEPGDAPEWGEVIYLVSPKQADFHIVELGEDLAQIAAMHGLRLRRLQRLNRMDRSDLTIYVGQKLHLRFKKKKDEKMIVLMDEEAWQIQQDLADANAPTRDQPTVPVTPLQVEEERTRETEEAESVNAPEPEPTPAAKEPEEPITTSPATPSQPANPRPTPPQADQKVWIEHEVQPGETLWRIAGLYKTRVEVIQRINGMTTTNLQVGQKLQIMVSRSVLKTLDLNQP